MRQTTEGTIIRKTKRIPETQEESMEVLADALSRLVRPLERSLVGIEAAARTILGLDESEPTTDWPKRIPRKPSVEQHDAIQALQLVDECRKRLASKSPRFDRLVLCSLRLGWTAAIMGVRDFEPLIETELRQRKHRSIGGKAKKEQHDKDKAKRNRCIKEEYNRLRKSNAKLSKTAAAERVGRPHRLSGKQVQNIVNSKK